eukprot:jgi/Tetstr1/423373/TSEL_014060.t1
MPDGEEPVVEPTLESLHADECPKCLSKLSTAAKNMERRKPGEVSTFKHSPGESFSSSSGSCKHGGKHTWRHGLCVRCKMPEGYERHTENRHRRELERATPGKDIRKRCPTCDFSWLDRYRKPDCPKCNRPLEVVPRLKPGEVSTFKYKAGDALESLGGACRKGGYHYFKFGRCRKCGAGEGRLYYTHFVQAA